MASKSRTAIVRLAKHAALNPKPEQPKSVKLAAVGSEGQ